MTTNELFDLITSEPKWYASKLSAQSASNIKKKHKEGLYNNYEWFFGLFGYDKEIETWKIK